jgi:hypothetical protein
MITFLNIVIVVQPVQYCILYTLLICREHIYTNVNQNMQDLSILKYYVYVQVQCGYKYEREGCQALVKDNVCGAKR